MLWFDFYGHVALRPAARRTGDRRGGSSSRPASMHVDDYQRTSGRSAVRSDKVNVQQILADPKQLQVRPGALVVMMAFGPGLTLYAALLRDRRGPASELPHASRSVSVKT